MDRSNMFSVASASLETTSVPSVTSLLSEPPSPNGNGDPHADETVFFNEQHSGNMMSVLKLQQKRGEFCDVVLLMQEKQCWVHRCVLVANSPYFSTMLKEVTPGHYDVRMPSENKRASEVILDYMYTGNLSMSGSTVQELVSLADKLAMTDVKHCCCLYLQKNMDISNFWDIYQLAQTHNLPDLFQAVNNFMHANLILLAQGMLLSEVPVEQLELLLEKCNEAKSADIEVYKLQIVLDWLVFKWTERQVHYSKLLENVDFQLIEKQSLINMLQCSEHIKNSALVHDNVTLHLLTQAEFKAQHSVQISPPSDPEIKIASVANDLHNTELHIEGPRQTSLETSPETTGISEDKINASQTIMTNEISPPSGPVLESTDTEVQAPEETEGEAVAPSNTASSTEMLNSNINQDSDPVPDRCQGITAIIDAFARTGEEFNVGTSTAETSDVGTDEHQMHGRVAARTAKPPKKQKANTLPVTRVSGIVTRSRRRGRPQKKQAKSRITKTLAKQNDSVSKVTCTSATQTLQENENNTADKVLKKELTLAEWSPENELPFVIIDTEKKKRVRGKKAQTPEEMYRCSKCPRAFYTPNALKQHMKGHGSDVPFLCEICGFSTIHAASMNVHKKQHTGNKFKCTVPGCDYATIRKSRLTDHMNAHQGIKNHVCSICGKAFAARKHLHRHEKIHVTVKPITCEECEYSTTRKDKLRDHVRKHHPETAIVQGILSPNSTDLPKPTPKRKYKGKKPQEQQQQQPVVINIQPPLQVAMTLQQPLLQAQLEPQVQVQGEVQVPAQVQPQGTPAAPPHLAGATTISDEMIQYLANMACNDPQTMQTQIPQVTWGYTVTQTSNIL